MRIILDVFLLVIGFALLIKGADFFVDASVNVARWLRVPGVIIGLTVVAIGTSMPEMVVSLSAAAGGATDMAVGNAVGSNIFNLIFILGVCAVIRPVYIRFADIRVDFFVGVGAAVLLLGMMFYFADVIPRAGGAVMLGLFGLYMLFTVRKALASRQEDEGAGQVTPISRSVIFIVLGLVLIVAGGQLAVMAAINVARTMGITERVIGLTVVAIGTSLPELVTALAACKKGKTGMDIALGNIIGSSIFNILFILGLTGVILPLTIDANLHFDLIFLIGGSFLFMVFVLTRSKIGRMEGALLALAYGAYMAAITIF
ncbi:MAG: calcium/sodium antiporter [Defluviitaleaceae bacterium]|nr:calcium/sodium antiporter [Defluviitaleaceae bacterium]